MIFCEHPYAVIWRHMASYDCIWPLIWAHMTSYDFFPEYDLCFQQESVIYEENCLFPILVSSLHGNLWFQEYFSFPMEVAQVLEIHDSQGSSSLSRKSVTSHENNWFLEYLWFFVSIPMQSYDAISCVFAIFAESKSTISTPFGSPPRPECRRLVSVSEGERECKRECRLVGIPDGCT